MGSLFRASTSHDDDIDIVGHFQGGRIKRLSKKEKLSSTRLLVTGIFWLYGTKKYAQREKKIAKYLAGMPTNSTV